MDQARIKRRRDDVVAAKTKFGPVGHSNLVRHIFAGEGGQCLRAGDFHFVVNGARMNVESAAEQVGKAEHIVDLIGVIGPTCGDDHVFAHSVHFFGGYLGVGVCHGENDCIWRHAFDHRLGYRTFGRDAKEDVTAGHRLCQCPRFCGGGVG